MNDFRRTITQLRDLLGYEHRYRTCRRAGHEWSRRTDPSACARCGALRTYREG